MLRLLLGAPVQSRAKAYRPLFGNFCLTSFLYGCLTNAMRVQELFAHSIILHTCPWWLGCRGEEKFPETVILVTCKLLLLTVCNKQFVQLITRRIGYGDQ